MSGIATRPPAPASRLRPAAWSVHYATAAGRWNHTCAAAWSNGSGSTSPTCVCTTVRAAHASARDVRASAYTLGSHVVFAAGRYAPFTDGGRALLAHELTHVVQQHGARPAVMRAPIDPPVPSTSLTLPIEGVDMPWIGSSPNLNSSDLGYRRDSRYFWAEYQARWPEQLSPFNRGLIANNSAPIVDGTWLKYHPQHSAYLGDTLEHHHVGQGSRCVAMPERLHDAYTVFHPQRRTVGSPARPAPTGGELALPPRPTRVGLRDEVERHVREGRLSAVPNRLPEIPPGSPLAALPGDQRGKIKTPPAMPAPKSSMEVYKGSAMPGPMATMPAHARSATPLPTSPMDTHEGSPVPRPSSAMEAHVGPPTPRPTSPMDTYKGSPMPRSTPPIDAFKGQAVPRPTSPMDAYKGPAMPAAPESAVKAMTPVGRPPVIPRSSIRPVLTGIALNVLLFAVSYYLQKRHAEKQARKLNADLARVLPDINVQVQARAALIGEMATVSPLLYANVTVTYTRDKYEATDYNEGSMKVPAVVISHQNYQVQERLIKPYTPLEGHDPLYLLTFSVPLFEETIAEEGASSNLSNYRALREMVADRSARTRLKAAIRLYMLVTEDRSLDALAIRDFVGLLRDEDAKVRLAAANFLSKLGARIAIPYMREVLTITSDDGHKALIQGYLRDLESG
jgi:hypothetical protein